MSDGRSATLSSGRSSGRSGAPYSSRWTVSPLFSTRFGESWESRSASVSSSSGLNTCSGGTAAGIRVPGLTGFLGRLQPHVHRLINGPGIVGLGAAHGFLPCPILYPAYLFAFVSGSALTGGIALGAIGLGTFPTVFAFGTLLGSVDVAHRRRVHRVLGVVFAVLGYVLIAHGLAALGVHIPHPMLPRYQPLG